MFIGIRGCGCVWFEVEVVGSWFCGMSLFENEVNNIEESREILNVDVFGVFVFRLFSDRCC